MPQAVRQGSYEMPPTVPQASGRKSTVTFRYNAVFYRLPENETLFVIYTYGAVDASVSPPSTVTACHMGASGALLSSASSLNDRNFRLKSDYYRDFDLTVNPAREEPLDEALADQWIEIAGKFREDEPQVEPEQINITSLLSHAGVPKAAVAVDFSVTGSTIFPTVCAVSLDLCFYPAKDGKTFCALFIYPGRGEGLLGYMDAFYIDTP